MAVEIDTLGTFSTNSYITEVLSVKDPAKLPSLLNKLSGPLFIIGEGSNTIISDRKKSLSVLRLTSKGTRIIKKNKTHAYLEIQAGENWDKAVAFAVKNGLSGIEALSAIPGTAGAAPIQNIGAYGAEVANVLFSLKAYDTKKKAWTTFANKDCKFSYRDSLFKRNPGRYVIVSIVLKLSHNKTPKLPDYPGVRSYFVDKQSAPLKDIRKAIIEIRKKKLPDPKVVPNCGSFFKNPFVSKQTAESLKKKFPLLPVFKTGNKYKLAAGFLIENAGLKGKTLSNIVIYEHNALVLTNPNKGSFKDMLKAKNTVQKTVKNKFGVTLEAEVNIVV